MKQRESKKKNKQGRIALDKQGHEKRIYNTGAKLGSQEACLTVQTTQHYL